MATIFDIFDNELIKQKLFSYLDTKKYYRNIDNIKHLRSTCKYFREKCNGFLSKPLKIYFPEYHIKYDKNEFYSLKTFVKDLRYVKQVFICAAYFYPEITIENEEPKNSSKVTQLLMKILFNNLNFDYVEEIEFECKNIGLFEVKPPLLLCGPNFYENFNKKFSRVTKLSIGSNISYLVFDFSKCSNVKNLTLGGNYYLGKQYKFGAIKMWNIISDYFTNIEYLYIDTFK